MDGQTALPAWARALAPELVRPALLQPRVSLADPLAARRDFSRATRLSRKLRPSPHAADVAVEDVIVEDAGGGSGLRVRRYRPHGLPSPAPALVYLHGGSFVAGDLDADEGRCLHLAATTPCLVVSVDYRRAPEHPFPAACEDAYDALCWVAGSPTSGADPRRVAVGGVSAGATLAAAVAHMTCDRGGPRLALQLLLFPALDDRLDSRSMRTYPRTGSWSVGESMRMWRHYLGDDHRVRECAYAVPARRRSFDGVAPAYVLVAEVDGLRDEALDYAVRMLRDGVAVELHLVAGTFHAFDAAAPKASLSERVLAEQAAALAAAFRAHPPTEEARGSQPS